MGDVMQQQAGKMVNGYAAPYNFSIFNLFRAAWGKVSGYKLTFWLGALLYFAVAFFGMMAAMLITMLIMTMGMHTLGIVAQVVLCVGVFLFLMIPTIVGVFILGVKRMADKPVRARMVFDYLRRGFLVSVTYIVPIVLMAVVSLLCAAIQKYLAMNGFSPLLIFVVLVAQLLFIYYIMFSLFFAVFLVAEKSMGVFHALSVSAKAFQQHWFKVFGFFVLAGLLILIAAIPYGVALFVAIKYYSIAGVAPNTYVFTTGWVYPIMMVMLFPFIWMMPWFNCAFGELYRVTFGVE